MDGDLVLRLNYHCRAMGACGASREEVATAMRTLEAVDNAGQAVSKKKDDTPEWKQECIDKYNECIDQEWVGSCHDCFRYCEGQHEWPKQQCYRPKRKR
jgi:hypothetical protein